MLIFFSLEKVNKEEENIDNTLAKQRDNDKDNRSQEKKKDSYRKNEK